VTPSRARGKRCGCRWFIGAATFFALAPPRPRQSSPSNLTFRFAFLISEQPFVTFYCLLASTLLAISDGDVDSPVGWLAFGLAVVANVGLVVIDLFNSIRFDTVVNAIEAFAAWVRSRDGARET
jgi:hypothetical protein